MHASVQCISISQRGVKVSLGGGEGACMRGMACMFIGPAGIGTCKEPCVIHVCFSSRHRLGTYDLC